MTDFLIPKIQSIGDNNPVNLIPIMEESTFNVICRAGFSSDPEPEFIKNYNYVFAKQKQRAYQLDFMQKMPTAGNIKFHAALNQLHQTVDDFVAGNT